MCDNVTGVAQPSDDVTPVTEVIAVDLHHSHKAIGVVREVEVLRQVVQGHAFNTADVLVYYHLFTCLWGKKQM